MRCFTGFLMDIFFVGTMLCILMSGQALAGRIEQVDLDASGVVDFADFLRFAQAFGTTDKTFDFDASGTVDFSDFTDFASLFGQKRAHEITIALAGDVMLEMVWIPPGRFWMGLPEAEYDSYPFRSSARREVVITQGFYLGKYEVTQTQFEAVTGMIRWPNSHVLAHPNHPAVNVVWDDTQIFVVQLNQANGTSAFRLPTEAEWEYACKAGADARWSFGDETEANQHAWYRANTWDVNLDYAQPVGGKLPNSWGLYDMHGNVSERVAVSEDMSGSRLIKGGSIDTGLEGLAAAWQGGSTVPQFNIGFRLVRKCQILNGLPFVRKIRYGHTPDC